MDDFRPIDQSDIDIGKRKADAYLKSIGLNDAQVLHIRQKCKTDTYFLGYSILGYNKLAVGLHGNLTTWMMDTQNEQFRLILLPRSHYKTTVATITDTVQIILPVSGDIVVPYPRDLGTNCRLLLCHEKAGSAERFLFSISQHFTTNFVLTAFFPECVPDARKHRINKSELELPRESIWSEPTVDTMGVGGKNQGRHYNIIKGDDLYGAEATESKAERETTIQWFDNIQSFLVTPLTDHIDVSGTRWAFDDIYAHYMNVYGIKSENGKVIDPNGMLVVYKKAAIENGQPIFPEQFSLKSFEILKKNRRVWNAQYVNDPKEGAAKFQPEWLQYYNRKDGQIVIFEKTGPREIHRDRLVRYILFDPAVTGKFGLVVVGILKDEEGDDKIFILDAMKKEMNVEEQISLIFKLVRQYAPHAVIIEEVLFSALYEPIFRRDMRRFGMQFRLIMHKQSKTAKDIRVEGLANFFSAKQIYMHSDMDDLITEFHQFGATDDYHMLDALAMGPYHWRAGYNLRLRDQFREAEDRVAQGFDPLTGYSRIR